MASMPNGADAAPRNPGRSPGVFTLPHKTQRQTLRLGLKRASTLQVARKLKTVWEGVRAEAPECGGRRDDSDLTS